MTVSQSSIINCCKLLRIEDMISTVFLLSNNHENALHIIKELGTSKSDESISLLQQFLLQCFVENSDAHNNFIEAMVLLKNFRVIRMLGLSKSEAFLPPFVGNIHSAKTHLYKIADSLNMKQTEELIRSIDDGSTGQIFSLEEAILDWQIRGLINFGTDFDSASFEPLTKYLNTLEKQRSKKHSFDLDKEFYPLIDSSELGLCIVINNSEFTRNNEYPQLMPDHNLLPRPGSEKDIVAIREVFTWLKFQVLSHENVTYHKLKELLSFYAQKVKQFHSCMALIVMSHGTDDVIYTSDSVPVSVEALEMAFQRNKCPQLTGKPKILIIQACQGSKLQAVMKDTSEPATLEQLTLGPERGDAVIAWSTVKGYASLRDRFDGSWFIQELCKELKENAASRDFVEIVTRVNNHLRSKTYHGIFMVPSLSMSLCKKIKLM